MVEHKNFRVATRIGKKTRCHIPNTIIPNTNNAAMKFTKYHGLGNDYLVIGTDDLEVQLTITQIQRICHRHYGVGSDGILLGPIPSESCDFGLRILNPDGSEAEKSGNGLRIFSRFLWDEKLVSEQPFTVETLGGNVTCQVNEGGKSVTVEMGQVRFRSEEIPVAGPSREVLNEEIELGEKSFTYCAATVGNPHCVVLLAEEPTAEVACRYGPRLENDPRFAHRTNVQFMNVLDRQNIQIEIWERGAGYTLASGSSSTAAAAVARKLGLCDEQITVHMPGGNLLVEVDENFAATMTGPVTKVCTGALAWEVFEDVRAFRT